MRATFTISILAWDKALPLARPVREEVFVEEQRVPRELELDEWDERSDHAVARDSKGQAIGTARLLPDGRIGRMAVLGEWRRSEEHTSELQSQSNLVCRLLLEKKKIKRPIHTSSTLTNTRQAQCVPGA